VSRPIIFLKRLIPQRYRSKVPPGYKLVALRLLSQVQRRPGENRLRMTINSLSSARPSKLLESHFLFRTVFQIQASADEVARQCRRLDLAPDLVIAHELLSSGLAGLELKKLSPNTKTLLDNVEYPRLSGRQSLQGTQASADPIADHVITGLLVGIANQYDHIIATSSGQVEVLAEMGVSQCVTLIRNARSYKGIGLSSLQKSPPRNITIPSLRECIGCDAGDVIILYNNHVYDHGGAEELLQALPLLPDHFRVAFLGELRGGTKASIEAIISRLSLSQRVTFLDLVPPAALVNFVSGADAVIMPLKPIFPNYTRCLPNRLFEAISAHVPVITYAASEIGAFVKQHGVGVVFEDFSETSIAAAIVSATDLDKKSKLKDALKNTAQEVCWENEVAVFKDAIVTLGVGHGGSCVFVACKDIERNDRISRLCRAITECGLTVDVLAHSMPRPELQVPGVHYHVVR
jgi:glycosyltransferase involved in cell wall biosynthesis